MWFSRSVLPCTPIGSWSGNGVAGVGVGGPSGCPGSLTILGKSNKGNWIDGALRLCPHSRAQRECRAVCECHEES